MTSNTGRLRAAVDSVQAEHPKAVLLERIVKEQL